MDPDPMPWRSIDRASASPSEASDPAGSGHAPLGAVAIAAAAGLVLVAAFVLAFGTGGGGIEVGGGSALDGASDGGAAPSASLSDVGPDLVVEIVGAVLRPGVYHLAPGARVGDLVLASGGYGPRVDAEAASRTLNLAARLADGDQVRVPSRDDEPASSGGGSGGSGASGGSVAGSDPGSRSPLDLNTASSAELEALPGIGPATAAKILAARVAARFVAVEDLRTRKLVGQKTFDGLEDLVTVR